MKKIIVLGSTGSIGTQTLEILRQEKERFGVSVLACGHRLDLLRQQIEEFAPGTVAVAEKEDARTLQGEYPSLEVLYGEDGLAEAARREGELLLNALVGIRGLGPTLAAIEAGKDIALANKETLVTGGELVMERAAAKGVKILPVDSEHSAIFQCLQAADRRGEEAPPSGAVPLMARPKEIWLTASGGGFRGYSREELAKVTLEEALRHPNWSMGQKITIDSATMVNKGLEIMEAKHLFGLAPEQIRVLVHPQSIVHSLVRFPDEALLAQLGTPDMKIPISYALHYPERHPVGSPPLDLCRAGHLDFEEVDREVFRSIPLAYEALSRGGSAPVAYNGANELLVEAFLRGRIRFLDILEQMESLLSRHRAHPVSTAEEVWEADREIRERTREAIDAL